MAIVHRAELTPSKIELIQSWAPHQPFYRGDDATELSVIGSFRFDDPEGEVGIETLVVRVSEGELLHIPLTYRGAPLAGAEPWLIGTMEHSVLGARWVYDATGDPVYLAELGAAAATGGTEVEQFVTVEGVLVPRESTAHARGSGSGTFEVDAHRLGTVSASFDGYATVVTTDDLHFAIARRISDEANGEFDGYGYGSGYRHTLSATWAGQPVPLLLAVVWE
jgi:hypothetical protein